MYSSLLSRTAGIQNTTWGGIQGFSRKPSTPWFDDSGNFAGIVHQERNLTFALFKGASHLVPQKVPAAAFVLLLLGPAVPLPLAAVPAPSAARGSACTSFINTAVAGRSTFVRLAELASVAQTSDTNSFGRVLQP